MPAAPPDSQFLRADDPASALTELDALATPFDLRGTVDVLLDDLGLGPAPTAPVSTLAAERSVHRAAMATRRGGGGRPVLVVDASAIARKFLMHRLDALGYHAHGAESGEEALALIEQQVFWLVFVELVLSANPGIDGLALCLAIKRHTGHSRARVPGVVMVTGRGGSTHRVRSSLAGCDAYLTKPLTDAAFLAALAEVDPLFK